MTNRSAPSSFSILGFTGLAAFLALIQTASFSFAKAHPSQEVYSATIDDGTAQELGAHCNIESDCAISSKSKKHSMQVRQEIKKLPPVVLSKPKIISVSASLPAVAAPLPTGSLTLSPASEPDLLEPHFDNVPKEKVTEISERMIYSYEILKRFGRAYDYRTTKLGELKRILKDLERTSQTARN